MSCIGVKPRVLAKVTPGMTLVTNGNHVVDVPESIAEKFMEGDKLFAIERPKNSIHPEDMVDVLHVPKKDLDAVNEAVSKACSAFEEFKRATDDDITTFFRAFAARLADDVVWAKIAAANQHDVEVATAKKRSTTRLRVSDDMRKKMIEGLEIWASSASPRSRRCETVNHDTWTCDMVSRELGTVAFVFEGRPNVLADAAGVLRAGNTVVLRIGSDAMGTALAMEEACIIPALQASNLPEGSIVVLKNPTHATSWALFADSRLRLAVARGSGRTVDLLGCIAQGSGVPVSLHGTGGAWGICSKTSTQIPNHVQKCVTNSLDRKVCNTLNTIVIPRDIAPTMLPFVLAGLKQAGDNLKTTVKIHAHASVYPLLPEDLKAAQVDIIRAEGIVSEKQVEVFEDHALLGLEWEWEGTPEVTITLVEDVDEAVALYNRHSPFFVTSFWSTDEAERQLVYKSLNAPFVGDGFTRWVDGQRALCKPELGLSSWEQGRQLGRPGVLTGDVITSRVLVHTTTVPIEN